MSAILISFDHRIFHLINGVWTNSWMNSLMPVITDFHKILWVRFVLLPLVIAIWIWKRRGEALKVILVLALVAGATDLAAHRIIKPLVGRLRPPLAGIPVVLRAPFGGSLSFPSNHAANMFAAATVLSEAYPVFTAFFYSTAAIVSYSRIYVGVHFPLDVIGGALLGWLIAFLGIIAARRAGIIKRRV
jgi:undecaprenyl-diphosphatase